MPSAIVLCWLELIYIVSSVVLLVCDSWLIVLYVASEFYL
jgi:hypothetical protein